MAGEHAKENGTLIVECIVCRKVKSTELVSGLVVVLQGRRRSIPVCEECAATGWPPPKELLATIT